MHSTALALLPVVAAEKSKVPWFIAGGVLAAWAMVVSVGIGFRHSRFPGSLGGQRTVIAISLVLVAAALSMAVITSGSPAKSGETLASTPPSGARALAPPGPPSGATGPLTTSAAAAGAPAPAAPSAPATPSSVTSGPASSVALSANPSGLLSYNTKLLSAKAGTVTIAFTNMASLEHNVTVAQGSTVLGATPTFAGGTRKLTLKLAPGTYTFYCSVPGHRMAGMEGTLRVT